MSHLEDIRMLGDLILTMVSAGETRAQQEAFAGIATLRFMGTALHHPEWGAAMLSMLPGKPFPVELHELAEEHILEVFTIERLDE